MAELNLRQESFVREYLVDLDATQAAIRAGYSAKTAGQLGWQLLQKPSIELAIRKAQAERAARTAVTADMVLTQWWSIATADPNDLMQLRRACCRHCHGHGHGYHWTVQEYARAVAKAGEDEPPDVGGGMGYDRTRDPHPGCPECLGEGVVEVHPLDSRKVKGKARLLYAGVKQTKDGIEVKMRDQDGALDKVARHLGMYVDRQQVSGPNGGPVQMEHKAVLPEELRTRLRELAGMRPDEP